MSDKATESMIQRVLVGSAAMAMFAAVVAFAHAPHCRAPFAALLAVLIGLALWEYYELTEHLDFRPLVRTGIWGTCGYISGLYFASRNPAFAMMPHAVLLVVLAFTFWRHLRQQYENPLANLSVTLFGFVYLVVPLGCLFLITYAPNTDGRWWLLYLVLVTKMTDTGALFFGKSLGKRHLAPKISPNKTWEGAIGGTTVAVVTGLIVYLSAWESAGIELSIVGIVLLSFVISVVAQFGDLAESLIKRNAGIKDSSYLPGLGGVLDIFDSLIFTAPLCYLYIAAFVSV